ncbi:alpha/beta hydrolase [Pseudonocardia abyssalis]|uniref:Alpha/beta fold hydrolase n=1 Tax=Pseudonocardia abyssalis TaxID=2792008 RepID=A0ABS6ULV4_9PSEU|nr:alpha/beta hydrolase [Pseudonocardia abyssalis]MBW0117004.1 alpha/beta fold hydrolase [Pseudonocardia abyssalis]MBW0132911.1 alpha/beta fold hydrolase [Pseudonocardia abyssalis]
MRSRTLTVLLTAGVLAAGCSTGVAAGGSAAPAVAWQECGPSLDCATLDVPVDHADPDGDTVGLALVRHRATDPAQRIGSLLYNPGGPGGSANEAVRTIDAAAGTGPWSPELLARFDIVGMDPRGVGESEGIRCLDDPTREENLALDLDPTLPGGMPRADLDAEARELIAGCEQGVDPALLANMATDDVARDIDLVRAALGEDRISYLGASYGTLLGATYATLFPDRVRHMVLDAAVDPTLWQNDPIDATTAQALGGERMLDAYLAACVEQGCPFGAGDPGAALDALVTRLEAQPLEVPAANGLPAGRLDGAAVLLGARIAMFAPSLWPVLTTGLLAAEGGDGSILLGLSTALSREPDGSPGGLLEANTAVNCLDRAVPTDPAVHDANAAEIVAAAPRFGGLTSYLMLTCAAWPVPNPDRFTGPLTGAGAPPILVVGGREDAQTPYPWSVAMADGLESGVLLTREGYGHGSYRASGPCVDTAVDRYLVDGTAPADGTVCAQEPAPSTLPMAG